MKPVQKRIDLQCRLQIPGSVYIIGQSLITSWESPISRMLYKRLFLPIRLAVGSDLPVSNMISDLTVSADRL